MSTDLYVPKAQYDAKVLELTEALEMLYDKYEDGDPCTENGDPEGSPMGNCVSLSYEEETLILSLIPKVRR